MTNAKKRIMIVDDEPLIGSSLEEALQKWNFDATLVTKGESAMEELTRQSFDMILTDIRMPTISGMEVLEKVKKTSPATPVVMITAFGTIDQAVEAMKKGAYDYITKPFSLDEIKFCLEKYFKTKDLEEENSSLKRALKEKYSLENFIGENQKIIRVHPVQP